MALCQSGRKKGCHGGLAFPVSRPPIPNYRLKLELEKIRRTEIKEGHVGVFCSFCFRSGRKVGKQINTLKTLASHFESSVQFNLSVVSDSLWPHEPQHAKPPCTSPTPGVHSDSRPSSQWCHPVISSSVVPFSSCPQSLPASGSFQMNQFFTSGGQNIGVSASALVLPMNI